MDVSMMSIFIMVPTMLKLSSKLKNIIFWVLTTSIALIIFGVFIIDIFVTAAHGGDKLSIIFSYLSTVFAFVSSLALFATIGVYFWQKNDKNQDDDKRLDIYKTLLKNEIGTINEKRTRISKISKISKRILNNQYDRLSIRFRSGAFSFIFHTGNSSVVRSITFKNHEFLFLMNLSDKLSILDIHEYERCKDAKMQRCNFVK